MFFEARGIAIFDLGPLPAFTSATLDLTFGKEFGGPLVFAYTRDGLGLTAGLGDFSFPDCGALCAPLAGGSPIAVFDIPSGSGFPVSIPFTVFLGDALGAPFFDTLGIRIQVAGGPFGFDALAFLEGAELVLETSVIPIPAALPLLIRGLGALGLMGWRRRRTA